MDLIPRPDQVMAAVANIAQRVVSGGLADLRTMPRTLIDDGMLREVYHYLPATAVQADQGDPVLLVTPLAAPSLCYDLRRGCSLVEHMVEEGRPTYLVEYGPVSFKERTLGIEHWIEDVVPAAVRAVSEHAGGRRVHVVGWSLGGVFALLAAADQPGLPIASLTSLGAPVDVKLVPLVAPPRPLLDLTEGRGLIARTYQTFGEPLVGWVFQLAAVQKMVAKPVAIGVHLDDAEFWAQLEAVDRFSAAMMAYPGRTFGQLYHRFVKASTLVGGSMEVGSRTISLADIEVPVLVVAGATDGIAPISSVQAVMPLLTGSPDARFEIVPGGHLGQLTGRAARHSTWVVLDDWFTEWSSSPQPASPVGGKTARARATSKRSATSRPAAAKRASKKVTPAKATTAAKRTPKRATADEIGTNPRRRYGSAGSRSLSH